MSVIVSGSGPSSRRLPASTNGTLRFHALVHDAAFQTPALDRLRDAAGVVDGVDGAHVIAVAVLFLAAVGQADAERRAEQRGFDIVHAERVAREQRVARSPSRISCGKVARAAGVDDDRAGDDDDLAALCSRASAISAAVCRTAVSTCRSDEIRWS